MKPKIILSRCFSEPVRYNGEMINDEFVSKLIKFVEYIKICPEIEIGLGVPRKRIIVVEEKGQKRLFQPETGLDFTEKMLTYGKEMLKSLNGIDGFVLKAKSPSCGVGTTKIYKGNVVAGKTYGFYAYCVKERLPYIPLEDEGRLKDKEIKRHFLTRIFAFSELRGLLKNPEPKELINFHSRYKYLLMTYNQKALKELGQLVADGKVPIKEKIHYYRIGFYDAFLRRPSPRRHLNTLMHIAGYVSKRLSTKEKGHLISLINRYGQGRVELKTITELLKNLAYRFDNDYILMQRYLEPYPEELDV